MAAKHLALLSIFAAASCGGTMTSTGKCPTNASPSTSAPALAKGANLVAQQNFVPDTTQEPNTPPGGYLEVRVLDASGAIRRTQYCTVMLDTTAAEGDPNWYLWTASHCFVRPIGEKLESITVNPLGLKPEDVEFSTTLHLQVKGKRIPIELHLESLDRLNKFLKAFHAISAPANRVPILEAARGSFFHEMMSSRESTHGYLDLACRWSLFNIVSQEPGQATGGTLSFRPSFEALLASGSPIPYNLHNSCFSNNDLFLAKIASYRILNASDSAAVASRLALWTTKKRAVISSAGPDLREFAKHGIETRMQYAAAVENNAVFLFGQSINPQRCEALAYIATHPLAISAMAGFPPDVLTAVKSDFGRFCPHLQTLANIASQGFDTAQNSVFELGRTSSPVKTFEGTTDLINKVNGGLASLVNDRYLAIDALKLADVWQQFAKQKFPATRGTFVGDLRPTSIPKDTFSLLANVTFNQRSFFQNIPWSTLASGADVQELVSDTDIGISAKTSSLSYLLEHSDSGSMILLKGVVPILAASYITEPFNFIPKGLTLDARQRELSSFITGLLQGISGGLAVHPVYEVPTNETAVPNQVPVMPAEPASQAGSEAPPVSPAPEAQTGSVAVIQSGPDMAGGPNEQTGSVVPRQSAPEEAGTADAQQSGAASGQSLRCGT